MLKATPLLLFTPPKTVSLHHPFTILNKTKKNPFPHFISCSLPNNRNFKITAAAEQRRDPELKPPNDEDDKIKLLTEKDCGGGDVDFGWLPAFPHVLTASMSNFLFGYHIGVMNGPIVSIAKELGFEGNSFLEGLLVSIFIGGAFIGSISCGSLVDKLGCRRTFQLDTIPLILGAIIRSRTIKNEFLQKLPSFSNFQNIRSMLTK
ncbi:hypothetical protein BUALT_Bualt09G0008600 [Buddleja alternifolia]|uniref:Major facilitator superfamily (MFS) profile domain-containing protein n=1 Tax=Buddleja alternifolia TaxID=168488 RepID=A0AAV6WYY0_9LAMI|nr:hypothetical protein BUALT_Bualt09G0008600 [Buddleja alternifolia]